MRPKRRPHLFFALISSVYLLSGCQVEAPSSPFEIQKNILGIPSEKSTAYLLLQPKRAVLINSGSEPEASQVIAKLAELKRPISQVHAVFITAAHPNLSAGAAKFTSAITYVGTDDYRALRADKHPKALLPKLQTRLAPRPATPHAIRVLYPGDRIQDQGFKIDVIATPGASRGSVMYLFDEVLFTGDGLYIVDGKPVLPSSLEVASRSDLQESLSRLVRAKFHTVADGRGHTASLGPKDIASFIQSLR